MTILLVDADSKIPNLALMKISGYMKSFGHEIEIRKLNYSGYPQKSRRPITIDAGGYDAVYISIIFTPNKDMIHVIHNDKVYYGGTGYDLHIELPGYIDDCDPDYSIYPESNETIGFLTRGCIRHCYFCFVPEKEGMLHEYWTLDRILNSSPHKKVRFLDNNFLAWKRSEEMMHELIDRDIPVSFNEGLDMRLMTDEKARLLSELNYYPTEYIFAFDDIKLMPVIERKTKILKKYISKDWKFKFYMYVHPDMPLSDTIIRLEWAKENKVLPYIMRDKSCYDSEFNNFYTDLASWGNQAGHFKKMTFQEFMERRTNNEKRRNESIKLYLDNI